MVEEDIILYAKEEPHITVTVKFIPSPEELVKQYDWDHDTAMAVMMAESGGNPDAYNPEAHNGCNGSVGLFQIACVHDDKKKLFDPEYNVQRAYEIWSEQNWEPWGAYIDGRYLAYL